MLIHPGAITSHPSLGRLTLQIPTIALVTAPIPMVEEPTVDAPDEWFDWLQPCGRRCPVCRGSGHRRVTSRKTLLYLSRAGYEANVAAIRDAFERAILAGYDRTNGEGWPAFERYAELHFLNVDACTVAHAHQRGMRISQESSS